MSDPSQQKALEEMRKRRRRERWRAFLMPLITLSSVVVSISLFMFLMKACQQGVPEKSHVPTRAPASKAGG